MEIKLHEEPHNIPGCKHPERSVCQGRSFLSKWAESALREQMSVSRSALEEIAKHDSDEGRQAREAISKIDNISF